MTSSFESIDHVFATPRKEVVRFRFDEEVVRVFPDMIRRSVPGYATIIDMIGVLAARFSRRDTVLYDLGCSLGAASLAMASTVTTPDCRIVAVDNSAAMIDEARQRLAQYSTGKKVPVELVQASLEAFRFTSQASMAVLNFTLQFLAVAERKALLARVAEALVPGGVLVLSEKICFEEAEQEAFQQSLYYAFKRNNGYSEMEISQKRDALEDVLIPETIATHRQRLLDVGFKEVTLWFRCFNFCSMIATR